MDLFVESLKRKTREFIRQPSGIAIEVIGAHDKTARTIELCNASLGGIACRSGRFWSEDEIIRLRIPFVDASFETQGKIVWCQRSGPTHFEVGIQFLEKNLPNRLRLLEQIRELEQTKQAASFIAPPTDKGNDSTQEYAHSTSWLDQAPA